MERETLPDKTPERSGTTGGSGAAGQGDQVFETGLTAEQTHRRTDLYMLHMREVDEVLAKFRAKRSKIEKQMANLEERKQVDLAKLQDIHDERVKKAGLLMKWESD